MRSRAELVTLFMLLGACGDPTGSGEGVVYAEGDESASSNDEIGDDGSGEGSSDGVPSDESEVSSDSNSTDEGESNSSEDDATSDTSSDDSSGDSDGNFACEEFSTNVALIPPEVMFLLDRSGSMLDEGFDPMDDDKTRWHSLYEAVESVVDEDADKMIAFGAKTFSTKGAGECGVSNDPDVPLMLNNAELLLDTIPGPYAQVSGGTPTLLALDKTLHYMQEYESQGDKFVILITDGAMGCTEDPDESLDDAVDLLETAYIDHEIVTFVVGIAPAAPGAIEQLEEMAIAGGAPKDGDEPFYRADDADQLDAALATVVEESLANSCTINLAQAPAFPTLTKVVIDGQIFDLIEDCETQDGFVYTNDDMTQIQVCGQACDLLGVTQMAKVEYFCDPG